MNTDDVLNIFREAGALLEGHFILSSGLIIPGYETARHLGLESIFTERENGEFVLRRGFALETGQKVLMVEDIVTTGLSSRECIKNARGGSHPDPVAGAWAAIQAGADGITAHLREDRRHITDDDITRLQMLCSSENVPLNMEMAATDAMLEIALRLKPHAVCIVPERREERTTEGGLDVAGQ